MLSKYIKYIVFVAVLVFCLIGPSSATDYYVDNDSIGCTEINYKSI